MDVTGDYKPPQPVEQKPKRTLWDLFLGLLSILFYPLKFARAKLKIVQEDTNKKRRFEAWRRRENARYRRGNRLNDEF